MCSTLRAELAALERERREAIDDANRRTRDLEAEVSVSSARTSLTSGPVTVLVSRAYVSRQ